MSKIILDQVTKRFGDVVAVDNLSLEIPDGAFFSLLGPSGCGKTTTMRLIAGFERPDSGRIWIGDRLVYDSKDSTFLAPARRGLGMVFQNYALWPHMTVKENILFGLKVRKVPKVQQKERMGKVMEQLQIGNLEGRYPHELSGGQQQRIALARELVTDARVLLMDEPLSNLDAKLRIDMRLELKRLHAQNGGTIIYVTHDQIEALTLSSQMVVMKEGLLQQVDTPDKVFAAPSNLFVASFMGNAPLNQFQGSIENQRLKTPAFTLPLPDYIPSDTPERSVLIAARPEELSITDRPDEWTTSGKIQSVMLMGYVALLHVALGQNQDTFLTVEHDQRSRLVESGEEVSIRFDRKTLHVFDAQNFQRIT